MTGAKFCDFEKMAAIFLKYWDKYLIDGVSYTLVLSAITVLGGVVFASLLALMKMSKVAPLRWLSTIYIEVIRGTPMLLQLYFFYFGLPMLIPALNKQKFLCIAIALICNSAAYVSEVIRSGIQAVDQGYLAGLHLLHWRPDDPISPNPGRHLPAHRTVGHHRYHLLHYDLCSQ